jgi:hypothetical protein
MNERTVFCFNVLLISVNVEKNRGWTKLLNEELHGLWHVARMVEVRDAYNILVGKPEGRGPLGSLRRIWEDNIKIDLGEIGFGDVDWTHLAQDRDRWRALVNTVMNLRVP